MTEAIAAVKPSLVRKLCNVMGAIDRVAKTGHNKFHNYDYATESDITAAVRGEMATQGVMLITTIKSVDWQAVETKSGGKERFCTLAIICRFMDADSADVIEVEGQGQGQDPGDKALFKALTGAVKYVLLKQFLIPTGNDPEAESPESVPVPKADPAVEKGKAERIAAWRVDVEKFKELGKGVLDLNLYLGRNDVDGTPPTNDEWAKLRKWGAELKKAKETSPVPFEKTGTTSPSQGKSGTQTTASTPPLDVEEEARRLVREQAEASLAEADAARAAAQKTQDKAADAAAAEQTERALKDSLFRVHIEKVRIAKTPEELALRGAEFAATPGLKWAKGELTAYQRAATDRLLILKDAQKEAAKPPASEPF